MPAVAAKDSKTRIGQLVKQLRQGYWVKKNGVHVDLKSEPEKIVKYIDRISAWCEGKKCDTWHDDINNFKHDYQHEIAHVKATWAEEDEQAFQFFLPTPVAGADEEFEAVVKGELDQESEKKLAVVKGELDHESEKELPVVKGELDQESEKEFWPTFEADDEESDKEFWPTFEADGSNEESDKELWPTNKRPWHDLDEKMLEEKVSKKPKRKLRIL